MSDILFESRTEKAIQPEARIAELEAELREMTDDDGCRCRCSCGCYPTTRWWKFAGCYVIECDCCKKSVMHKRVGTARLLWYRLVSEFLSCAEEAECEKELVSDDAR